MVIISDMGKFASEITRPVINLVREAIGSTAWSFLRSKTSWVSWSITKATLERRSSGSMAPCKPANLPKEGRSATAASLGLRVPWRFLATDLDVAAFFWATGLRLAVAFSAWAGKTTNMAAASKPQFATRAQRPKEEEAKETVMRLNNTANSTKQVLEFTH
jgi:hypothetical protein